MSRVHDALRKAAQETPESSKNAAPPRPPRFSAGFDPGVPLSSPEPEPSAEIGDIEAYIQNARRVDYSPLSDALLVNPAKPREAPAEEFRTLRTRLNHLQTLQPLHTLVVTSASPAEGKSFTAANLALTQAQLADKRVLLADFDFRRPTVDKTFQIPISPGMTNYLQGTASLGDILMRVNESNLYVITAGDAVPNPLELLNLRECQTLIAELRTHFDWIVIDSPPLLFAADGNLLATMCDGTILVVRIGTTTFDSVSRALQSLCENNVLGIVVNGARRGELYSKYTYYHDYYAYGDDAAADAKTPKTTEDEFVEAE
jgi:receptor protein-tyrosine kinase